MESVKVSVLALPTKLSIFENPPVPVSVPLLSPVIVQVLATLSPVSVSVPARPSIAPESVPPFSVNVSAPVVPVRFSMLVNEPTPVAVPLSAPVTK